MATIHTMKAVRIHHYGGPETLEFAEAPRPDPGPGEVRVRVCAAGVNPIDWKVREGYVPAIELPVIPGWDVSGTVDELGPGVSDFKVGDEVFTREDTSRDGAYAEFTV